MGGNNACKVGIIQTNCWNNLAYLIFTLEYWSWPKSMKTKSLTWIYWDRIFIEGLTLTLSLNCELANAPKNQCRKVISHVIEKLNIIIIPK